MQESSNPIVSLPAVSAQDMLTSILRDGAQQLLIQAVEAEVAEWIDAHRHFCNEQGHRQVVRNGHLPERTLMTGVGPVTVKQPRASRQRSGLFQSRCRPLVGVHRREIGGETKRAVWGAWLRPAGASRTDQSRGLRIISKHFWRNGRYVHMERALAVVTV